MNIFDIVTPQNIVAYWDNTKANQTTYLSDYLFPKKKVMGLEINKISGYAGLPVTLKPSAFDTQATFRDRQSVELQKSKMPFFRERMKVDEETRQQIMAISNDSVLEGIVSNIFDDTNNLIRGARAQRERMAMELISTGKIDIVGNGVRLAYDYKLNRKQKTKASVKWEDAENSKPLEDLMNWVDQFRTDFRIALGYAVMTTKTFNLITASKEVKQALYPNAVNAPLVTAAEVKSAIQKFTGLTVLINDNSYRDAVGGTPKTFFPDDVVTLLPVGNGVIGNMFMGTTPEEADLLNKQNNAVSIIDTGVAVFTRTIEHPVNVETIVSQICLPSFSTDVESGAGSILIASVN